MKLKLLLSDLEKKQIKPDLPGLSVGDTVKVGVLIREGTKERIQSYQGTIIGQRGSGINKSLTVRRTFQGIGVEKVFTIHSPCVKELTLIRRAKVRRAKIYYLRDRSGKATRLKERLRRVR